MQIVMDIPQKGENLYEDRESITKPEDIYTLKEVEAIKGATQEHFLFIGLDNKNNIRSLNILGIGNSSSIIIESKHILRTAIVNSCEKVILVHNHPSNSAKPSKEDKKTSSIIKRLLDIYKINLVDHIIVTENEFYSMGRNNELDCEFINKELDFIEKELLIEENKMLKEEIKQNKKYSLREDFINIEPISRELTEKDKEQLEQIYFEMNKRIGDLNILWDKIPNEIRDKLDYLFNERYSPSYCLKWMEASTKDLVSDSNNIFENLKMTVGIEDSQVI